MLDTLLTIFFAIILISVVLLHVWYVAETNKEKSKLINALISKSPEQFRDLNLADKVKPIEQPKYEQQMPDLIPEQNLDDEAFDQYIADSLNNS